MNFKIIDGEKEIICNILLTFKDQGNNINYIVYTDGTKDNNGDLKNYASRYILENGNYVLKSIENDSEWDLIDSMLESKLKELDIWDV